MAILARVASPNGLEAPDSTPRRVVAELPDIEIEVVRFEWTAEVAVPYFWVRNVQPGAFRRVMNHDAQITAVTKLEESDEASLFKAKWAVDSPLITSLLEADGKVRRARGTNSEWRLTLWFESRADASTFQQACGARDLPLHVAELLPLADAPREEFRALSDAQRRTLVLAYREGYFAEPRAVTQTELADELGITSSAVSGRLRRGLATLVENHLIE